MALPPSPSPSSSSSSSISLRSIRLFIRWVVFPALTFILVGLHLTSHSLLTIEETSVLLPNSLAAPNHHVYYGSQPHNNRHIYNAPPSRGTSSAAAARRLRDAFQERQRRGGAVDSRAAIERQIRDQGRQEERERRLSLANLRRQERIEKTNQVLAKKNHKNNNQQQLQQLRQERDSDTNLKKKAAKTKTKTAGDDDDDFLDFSNSKSEGHSQTQSRGVAKLKRHMHPREAPKRTYPQTKIFFFVHIHKSAGSIMCSVAHHSGWSVNYGHNCNVQEDQKCCGNADTLEAQQQYALNTKYDMVAAEMPLYSHLDYEHYNYIVVLRNSKQRYFSHWKHILREKGNAAGPQALTSSAMAQLRRLQRQEQAQQYLQRHQHSVLNPQQQPRLDPVLRILEKDNKDAYDAAPTGLNLRSEDGTTSGNNSKDSHNSKIQENNLKKEELEENFKVEEEQQQQQLDDEENPNQQQREQQQPQEEIEEQQQQQQQQEILQLLDDKAARNNNINNHNSDAKPIIYNDKYRHPRGDRDHGAPPHRIYKTGRLRRRGRGIADRRPKIMMHPSQDLVPLLNGTIDTGTGRLGGFKTTNHWGGSSRGTNPLMGNNSFSQWWKQQPDNWNFRQICGPKCRGVPKYHLTLQEHWIYVLERLSKFHTILFQETLQESLNTFGERLVQTPPQAAAKTEEDADTNIDTDTTAWFIQTNLTTVQAMVTGEERAKKTIAQKRKDRKKRERERRERHNGDDANTGDENGDDKKADIPEQQQRRRRLLEVQADVMSKVEEQAPVVTVHVGGSVGGNRADDSTSSAASSPSSDKRGSATNTTTTTITAVKRKYAAKSKHATFAERLHQRNALLRGGGGRGGGPPMPPPGPEQLEDWDERMSALDDALYEIAMHWEQQKQEQQQQNAGIESAAAVVNVEGWKELLSASKRETLERYFDNAKDSPCTNECCAIICSAW